MYENNTVFIMKFRTVSYYLNKIPLDLDSNKYFFNNIFINAVDQTQEFHIVIK